MMFAILHGNDFCQSKHLNVCLLFHVQIIEIEEDGKMTILVQVSLTLMVYS